MAILDNNRDFQFPKGKKTMKKIKDFLDKKVDEKYYYTSDEYFENENEYIFTNKKRKDINYIIDKQKALDGGRCGMDTNSKFYQSKRVFSENGFISTITASNTADNGKVLVESGVR